MAPRGRENGSTPRPGGPARTSPSRLAPDLIGADDVGEGFAPHDAVIGELWRRHRGVRLTKTHAVVPTLIAAIFEQKVTGLEARRAWRGLVRAASEPAPGPGDLWLPPDPERVAALPSFAFHRFGVERARADSCGPSARARRSVRGLRGPPRRARR